MTLEEINNPHFPPRPIRSYGITAIGGFRLKLYSVVQQPRTLDQARFAGWEQIIAGSLPSPAVDDLRPGVGFVIMHQADAGDYLVLCWWDNRNELPIRVLVSAPGQAEFRPATERQSVCIWDLDVCLHERDALIRATHGGRLNADQYLDDTMAAESARPSPQGRRTGRQA